MSKDYQIVRRVLVQEQKRREGVYRYRPTERIPALREVSEALTALDRIKAAGEWKAVGKWWTDKFDE